MTQKLRKSNVLEFGRRFFDGNEKGVKKGFAYGEDVSAKHFSQDDRFNNPTLRQKILDAL